MGTHPIFESDFDCLTEFKMEGDGLTGVGFKILFNLSKEKVGAPVLTSYKSPDGGSLNLTGAGDKYYMDVDEEEDYSALGKVIAYITDIYIKLEKDNQHEEVEFSLTELLEWVSDERVTLLYNCHQWGHPGKNLGYVEIPQQRLCKLIKAF